MEKFSENGLHYYVGKTADAYIVRYTKSDHIPPCDMLIKNRRLTPYGEDLVKQLHDEAK